MISLSLLAEILPDYILGEENIPFQFSLLVEILTEIIF